MKKVFIISGASGAGKTTIYKKFFEKNPGKIQKIVTTTTRAIRDYETNHVDYHFVYINEFENLIKNNELIEYAKVHDNYYGSTYQELDNILSIGKIPLYIVDPQGVKFLQKTLSDSYDVETIFILPPNLDELKKRLVDRGEDPESEQFKIRIQDSETWINEKDSYNHCILNDDLQKAVEDLENIINK